MEKRFVKKAIVGYTVTKTMKDAGCDLELALSWEVATKNSHKNVNVFSPNELVFEGNANFPTALNSKLSAIVRKSSNEVVTNNINTLHTAKQAFIQSESSDRIWRALQYQTRTFGDVCYFTGGTVYYKRENDTQWHGPGTVIGQEGKEILVKHGSVYVRAHGCRITVTVELLEVLM